MADGNATKTDEAARTTTRLFAEQAAQAVAAAAAQRQCLSTAVHIATAVKKKRRVTDGMFEYLRQLREEFEKLERARPVLYLRGGEPAAPTS